MFSSWFKRSTVFALALLVLPAAAFAQTSRVEGMSLQGDYIKDYSAIYAYPSEVSNVGNLVWGELGDIRVNSNSGNPITLDRNVGAVLGNLWDGRYGTWGVSLHEQSPALGQGDAYGQPNPGGLGFDPNTNTNNSFDLMWGWRGGSSNIGLRLHRAYFEFLNEVPGVSTNLKFDPTTGASDNLSRNIWGIAGGIGFEMNPNTMVELAFDWQNRTFENSTPAGGGLNDLNEDDSPTTYSLSGRAFWQWQPNVMLVPVAKWFTYDLSRKVTPAGGTPVLFDNTMRGWQVGVAGNWTLGTDDLFVLGVTFAGNKVEQQEDLFGIAGGFGTGDTLTVTETLAPQVFAALETHVNNWLTLRFGANQGAFTKLKVEDQGASGANIETTASPFNMNIGAGVKVGTLQLDIVLEDTFPHTFGGWFSQISNYVSFPKVTATYAF